MALSKIDTANMIDNVNLATGPVTGTLATGNGGTGATSFNAASLVKLSSTTVSSNVNTIDFDGLFSTTYDKYLVSGVGLKISASNYVFYQHMQGGSAVTSSNYKSAAQVYDSATNTNNDAGNTRAYCAMMGVSQFGNNAAYSYHFNIFINNPLSTSAYCSSYGQSAIYTSSDNMQMANFSNMLTTSLGTATSGIRLQPYNAQFTSGKAILYGLTQ